MKIHFHKILNPVNLLAAVLLTALPVISQATPVTYDIQSGSAPGFSGSWIHSATTQSEGIGYFDGGTAAGVTGSLTIDTANLAATSGQLTTTYDNFGLGNAIWTLDFTGATAGTQTFIGGVTDIISLSYSLSSVGLAMEHSSSGTFYFAARDFNTTPISNGPNYYDNSVLYLWGNNWVNANGAGDRPTAERFPLGLDLYGVARPVPAPSIALLLGLGLLGLGARRIIKST